MRTARKMSRELVRGEAGGRNGTREGKKRRGEGG